MAPISGSELSDIIHQVLTVLDIPVSITLINTTLLSLFKMAPIKEKFLTEHNDKFHLQVIGYDLKISLSRNQPPGGPVSEKAKSMCGIIERDIRKVDEIKKSLQNDNITEILFDNLITKFSSRKKNINISFVVRNSHNLELFRRNDQTFVRVIDKDDAQFKLDNKEIISLFQKNNGFQEVLVLCLKNLLANFATPQNLGTLQASFSFGDVMIDNRFLRTYDQYFKWALRDSTTWVELNNDPQNEDSSSGSGGTTDAGEIADRLTDVVMCDDVPNSKQYALHTPQESSMEFTTENTTMHVEEEKPKESIADLVHINKQDLIACAQSAIEQNQSMIIVGDKEREPLFFDLLPNDNGYRMSVLQNVKKLIDEELERLKS